MSLPYLPVHFIHCRDALFLIVNAIKKPLRVDRATTAVNRPLVAHVLIEYDVSQLLLPRLWIGKGDNGVWQDIIYERVLLYCATSKHLGRFDDAYFVTNHGLQRPQ